jgi:hypothetical protein
MPVERRGHIKIARKAFVDDKWWREKRVFSKWEAWEDMIQLAQYEAREFTSTKFGTIRLERGEFVLSLRKMAERWNWSFQSVRSFTRSATFRTRLATQRETQAGTVYLIVNYDLYQSADSEVTHPTTQPATHLQHTSNTRTSSKALTTTTSPASPEAVNGIPKGRKPKEPPKYPDYPNDARVRLHAEWVAKKGEYPMSRFVQETQELFPKYTVDQVSAAQSLAIQEAKAKRQLRFLKPHTVAEEIVDLLERAGKEPVVDGWFAEWTPQDAGLTTRRTG